jgi:hypothetical protein
MFAKLIVLGRTGSRPAHAQHSPSPRRRADHDPAHR